MVNLYELEHLVAFADLGTLAKVSEKFHLSTPSVTRSMQHLEEEFGVTLFTRGRNRIELNPTGEEAVVQARKLLLEHAEMLRSVAAFDRRRRAIIVASCAPAPLWKLLPELTARSFGRTVASSIKPSEEVEADLLAGACDIAVLPHEATLPGFTSRPYLTEHLAVCLRFDHELAKLKSLTFSDINGYNFLLLSQIGFWDPLCRRMMPSSRFLVQTEDADFVELRKNSSLPFFATNRSLERYPLPKDRVSIPLTDPEANVTFHLVERTSS